MSQPSRPHFLPEGPADACVLNGHQLGWAICTNLGFAMGMDKSTLGRVRMSGCEVRDATGDYIGGTTIPQNVPIAEAHGVAVEVHVGANVCTPYYAAIQAQAGRGFGLSGNLSATLNTVHRSNGVGVNHFVWINEVRGGTLGHPAEALVYDMAANGRKAPWGTAAQGPEWWPWSLVLAFAAALRPWGDSDPRLLGPGKFYCAIFPDTEPHVHLKFGGVRTTPFPDHLVGRKGASLVARRVRPGPGPQYAPTGVVSVGETFVAAQWVNGPDVGGRIRWYGNHDGNQWVAAAGLRGEGGT